MSESSGPRSSAPPQGYPAELERVWRLPDGTPVLLRALRPTDLERELAFIAGLSEKTLYLRVQYSAREFRREDAVRLLDLDYHDRLAIGAFLEADGSGALVGVSRYARIDDTDRAECAIVVADDWQERGVGTELMRSLVSGARAQGIRTLVGSSLAENRRIHAWARRFGIAVHTEPNSGGQARITLDVDSLFS